MNICFVLLEKILGNYRLSKHNRVYFEIQFDLSSNSILVFSILGFYLWINLFSIDNHLQFGTS